MKKSTQKSGVRSQEAKKLTALREAEALSLAKALLKIGLEGMASTHYKMIGKSLDQIWEECAMPSRAGWLVVARHILANFTPKQGGAS